MRVLAFDTATAATTVAVADGDAVLDRRDDPPAGARPRHTSRLMPLIAELLEEAGWGWEGLDRVAVGDDLRPVHHVRLVRAQRGRP